MKKSTYLTILIALFLPNLTFAQDLPEFDCTQEHDRAVFTMQNFLTAPEIKTKRISAGLDNIPINEIKHVEDLTICKQLSLLINSNLKYKEINNTTSLAKFYYQTNSFYYIFWTHADNVPRTGPKRIFIVVDKHFNVVKEFYI
jgi:hypothetical protein